MTNRNKKVKIYTPKTSDTKAVLKKDKPSKALRNIFVLLQSILGSFVVLCIFVYSFNSRIKVYDRGYVKEDNISFYDLSNDYYKSDVFKNNFRNYVEAMIRYVTISEQITRNGKYDPNIIIDVGEFAHRNSASAYDGPEIKYKLGVLLEWGEAINTDSSVNGEDYGSSICTYEFYTLEQYCKFFNIPIQSIEVPEDYDYESVYESFETLKDKSFRTIDGKRLNEYVDNAKDYSDLVKNVQKAVDDLYFNYTEYKANEFRFDENKTSFRYCVSKLENGNKKIYSNVSAFYKGIDEKFIDEAFIGYAEGLKTKFGNVYVDTSYEFYGANEDMAIYDIIREAVQRDYAYAFSGDTDVWVGVDTTYNGDSENDVFSSNYEIFSRSAKMVPFVISFGALAVICFIALFIIIIGIDRQWLSVAENRLKMNRFEKMPIESMILSFILLGVILYLGENWVIRELLYKVEEPVTSIYFLVPAVALMLLDLYIALSFLYSLIRRVTVRNVFEGSLLLLLAPKFDKQKKKLKGWIGAVSDSSAVAIRTWVSYVMFLLFNCFWVCVMFFSSHRILSIVVLLIFDLCVGAGLFNRNYEKKVIFEGVKRINNGDYDYKIDVSKMHGDNKELAAEVNNIGLGLSKALEISTRDEKLKADLITNVSHDIKTPLTSIINYVDLLKRENIEDERVKKYIAILDEKSQRLKQLTFDLLEASKVSSGNIQIDLIKIDLVEFSKQAVGEFEDKFEERGLELIQNVPSEPMYAMVDPRHMWRVVENILNNVYKYAMQNTRVYFDLEKGGDDKILLSLKNISNQQLNIPADELTERFIRGDVSRSTEGSGLGLSIAKNLTQAQGGEFDIYLDGDLFKVTITLAVAGDETEDETEEEV
ncbi:MAG: HAMP domain-containing histidine kinase [Lachnospiraceae bacterium]|nr:HAMP domain-containing histidine kinase [Lachnospiraceae bacterium]